MSSTPSILPVALSLLLFLLAKVVRVVFALVPVQTDILSGCLLRLGRNVATAPHQGDLPSTAVTDEATSVVVALLVADVAVVDQPSKSRGIGDVVGTGEVDVCV